MSAEELPVVTFGKYKDKSVLELMKDTSYVEWLKLQSWFPKQPIYNIVVNQTLSTVQSRTPEHNKLQNKFLDMKNVQIFLSKICYGQNLNSVNTMFKDEKFIKYFGKQQALQYVPCTDHTTIMFEDKFNWDVTINYEHGYSVDLTPLLEIDPLLMKQYKINYGKTTKDDKTTNGFWVDVYRYEHLFCLELKPSLGDDYPCVLRKMKTQIELTKQHKKNAPGGKFEYSTQIYVLLVGSFSSESATKSQLKEIFLQSSIRVLFTDEVFESRDESMSTIETLQIENKMLSSKLLQAEERILQLEEELKIKK